VAKTWFLCLCQENGNACLGILNGSEIGLKDLSIIGGRKVQTKPINPILFYKKIVHDSHTS
jgi:hypothetical protein